MKRITLVVPNKIIRVSGTSSYSQSKEIEVDSKSIVGALEVNDYHENISFPKGMIKVHSIEEDSCEC